MITWINNRYNGIIFGRTRLGEIFNAIYSTRLFMKYSFSRNRLSKQQNLRSFLIKQYHIIEKGMALPSPRQNFGIPKIKILISKTEDYEKKFGFDDEISYPIRNSLKEYLSLNPNLAKNNTEFHARLVDFTESAKDPEVIQHGGTKTFNIDELREITSINFQEFIESRTSVRNFKESKVLKQDIHKAVEIARNAPSVCNRQNWRLHYYDNPIMKTDLLNLQHGSGGFTDSIQGLFIVTTDLEGFTRLEQNQVFVDGGLISMNLVLSLHSLGIGSCCLNTCIPYTRENKIKNIGNIPKNERLIMMIGVGYWKDNFKVAYSKKKEVSEILKLHS